MFQLDILFQLFHHWCINVSNESSICSGTISFLRWLVFYKQWVVSCFLCYEALGFVLFHAHWASFHFFFSYYTGSHFHMGFLLFHVFICLLIVQFICFLLSMSTVVSFWIFFFEQNLQYVFLHHYFPGHLWIFLFLSTTCLQLYYLVDFSKTSKYFEEY